MSYERLPWLPEGRIVLLPGRGEVFARVHRHEDPTRPTLLLLHGWTASADMQFFTAYEALAEHYSFVAIDHRGHGRGMRTSHPFTLEDVADDAAALVRQLGIDEVITVGFSMGGPISVLLARRHPDLVAGLVVEATALEWRETRMERARWKFVRLLGLILRSWLYPRTLRAGINRFLGPSHPLAPYASWIEAETRRGDPTSIMQAGRALSQYDATSWAKSLGKPAGALVTTRDHLVPPRKQRALARALGAFEVDLNADHLANLEDPKGFSAATLELVDRVSGRVQAVPSNTELAS